MIDKLKMQQEELKLTIKAWEEYYNSPKKHYNIPHPNKLPYGLYTKNRVSKFTLPECKDNLNYLKTLCEFYDNNDYIIDLDDLINTKDEDFVKKAQITPEMRKKFHKVVDNFERYIIAVENDIEN